MCGAIRTPCAIENCVNWTTNHICDACQNNIAHPTGV